MNMLALFARRAPPQGGGQPPPAPLNVNASAVSDTAIFVSWSASPGATFYAVDYREGTTGGFILFSNPTGTSETVTGLTEETLYQFKVRAFNGNGGSPDSAIVSATTLGSGATVPAAPSGLTAVALTSNSIRLTWTDNSANEDGFRVYRSVGGGGFSLYQTLSANTVMFDDTSLTVTEDYAYTVSAFNAEGESSQAGPATVECLGCLNVPVLDSAMGDATTVTLNWSYTQGTAHDHTGFRVYRNGILFATVGVQSSFVTSLVTEGVAYSWQVTVFSGIQESSLSNARTAGRAPNTPSGLFVTLLGPCPPDPAGAFRFNYTDNSGNEAGFEIEQVGFAVIGQAGPNQTQVDVPNDFLGAPPLNFVVRATGVSGVPESANSNTAGSPC